MPSKLLILHGEAKSYCLTVSCVPESMFHYPSSFTVISFISTLCELYIIAKLSHINKNKGVAD